jgi:hypothetical protein
MLMLIVEGITRRTLSYRVRAAVLGAGAFAMLVLLVTTFYNDVSRLRQLNL